MLIKGRQELTAPSTLFDLVTERREKPDGNSPNNALDLVVGGEDKAERYQP
jgi:hypothetical protein